MSERRPPVLMVDDDEGTLARYRVVLEHHGVRNLLSCQDSREVLPRLRETPAGAVLLDLTMPHLSGSELLRQLREEFPDIPVIVATATDDLDTAVACMKLGAFDYLTKPIEESRLWSAVRHALELGDLQQEVRVLRRQVLSRAPEHPAAFRRIITASPRMNALFRYVEAVAASPRPVLVTGESGTGKELVALAVHDLSGRKGPFVAVNAAGLDDTVLSDTLFGHEKGAYTGADQARKGLVVQAAGGTLFLDEIGDLEQSSQTKLLRLLQEGEYYALGSDRVQLSNARVVAATNADVAARQREGSFRKDLYYRLMAHHVEVPPLRERLEDLSLLVDHFFREAARSLERPAPAVPGNLCALLSGYPFPGNIRELQGMIFDVLSRHQQGPLPLKPFRDYISSQGVRPEAPREDPGERERRIAFAEPFPTLREAEEVLMEAALKRTAGNQSLAAALLGINQSTLSRRLKARAEAERSTP